MTEDSSPCLAPRSSCFDAEGKIDSVRLYMLRDELMEIGGP
jgi:hypothetical protein